MKNSVYCLESGCVSRVRVAPGVQEAHILFWAESESESVLFPCGHSNVETTLGHDDTTTVNCVQVLLFPRLYHEVPFVTSVMVTPTASSLCGSRLCFTFHVDPSHPLGSSTSFHANRCFKRTQINVRLERFRPFQHKVDLFSTNNKSRFPADVSAITYQVQQRLHGMVCYNRFHDTVCTYCVY